MFSTALALLQEYNEYTVRNWVWNDHNALDSYLAGYNIYLRGDEKEALKQYFPRP
jgi:hypothetical protein